MPATLLSPTQVERLVERQAHLVAPSPTVQRLLDLTSDPDLDVPSRKIADILQSEPALAAQVLQWVNSAIFSLPSPISDITRAIPLLGLNRVRALALAQAFFNKAAKEEMSVYGIKGLTFCLHGVETAVGAAYLMKQRQPAREGDAFTAGLLHDIGMLLMGGVADNLQNQKPLLPADRPLCAIERERFGVDHATLGGTLAGHWRLSAEQKGVIADHHRDPDHRLEAEQMNRFSHPSDPALAPQPPADELPLIVQIADRCSERRLMICTATNQEHDLRRYRQILPDETSYTDLEDEMDRAATMITGMFGNSRP